MNWHLKFVKIASLVDEIDSKKGRPITREYLLDLYRNRPEEYKQFLQQVKVLVSKRIAAGEETVDRGVLSKMVKEILSTYMNRSDKDIAARDAERQKALEESAKKTTAKPPIDPAAHLDDHREYADFPPEYYEKLRAEHNLGDLPIARPLVKKPSTPRPTVVDMKPGVKPKGLKDNSEKTKVMDEYVDKDGKRRFRFAGVINNHPAMGQLCECGGKIARVQSCMRDGNGTECALVRYDNGDFDMVFLDWTE